jgi:hypothetical protein
MAPCVALDGSGRSSAFPLHVLYLVVTIPLYVAGILFEIAHGGQEGTDSMWRSIRNAQLEVRRWLFGSKSQDTEQ